MIFVSCKKDKEVEQYAEDFNYTAISVNGASNGFNYSNLTGSPVIRLAFSAPLAKGSLSSGIVFKDNQGKLIEVDYSLEEGNRIVVLKAAKSLFSFSKYTIEAGDKLMSEAGGRLRTPFTLTLVTSLDPADKFPRISDEELLTLVQRQTFKYFWDFGHPVSGMARERDSSGDIVTTGGTGFGVMAIITAIHRGFVTREEGLARIQKITTFLKNKAQRFHGAFPHWLNGNTGAVQPFSTKDNGADLVETSLLMQGLLTARQYFNGAGQEADLRNDINNLWNAVEWSWFRKDNGNALYWHWSPDYNWDMNLPVRGWNEALITYVLAASSSSHAIPKSVYENGWANNSSFRNGNTYFGVQLPLGPAMGGPLFFSHYSFMGINPLGLSDTYANYETQNKAHAQINYQYCKSNPKGFYGYGPDCWGLTASDDINGYKAHEPTNDNGVISPTAALSSFPYTPEESMKALKFFYYKLGDKVWKEYGFVDAFSLHEPWFASSFLAIDQGPIIVMIENYRSGLLWNLFMSCPEVKTGMRTLGFSSPRL
ncbi:glucoamylase family protein [Arcticibacter tournemirensis]|uniref:glucoamylase family protein n=1 Tax=Arcticibacter tournemirensis TaxID=699437 RepID=UPI00293903A8|nr:glucoamylase family protein [Arcticibacter tournemirensis]